MALIINGKKIAGRGKNGTNGKDGAGVPAGGTAGQVLAKKNGTDYNTKWVDPLALDTNLNTTGAAADAAAVGTAITAARNAIPTAVSELENDSNYLAQTGNGSALTAEFTQNSARTALASGDKLSAAFGKIAKWLADLGTLAFKSTVAKSDLAAGVQTSLGKADTALQTVHSATVSLSASSWVSHSVFGYSQAVSISGLTTDAMAIHVDVNLGTSSKDTNAAALEAYALVAANPATPGNGTITFYAESVPDAAVPLYVEWM